VQRRFFTIFVALASGCEAVGATALSGDSGVAFADAAAALTAEERVRLLDLVLSAGSAPPPDVTNRFADNPAAARFGQRLFFDPRFSGPLLDSANTGLVGTLGAVGETGKVACSSCHVPTDGFVDTRSVRGQLSLAVGWTHRRTPTVLDVAQHRAMTWDGRRDTLYGVTFGVVENPVEWNSSSLFVAQQVIANHRVEYESIFGPLPDLSRYDPVAAADAGCVELPADPVHERCAKPGADDPDVVRIVANIGKALAAYMRQLSCGRSRFDAWMDGDVSALDEDEVAGARIFVGKGECASCHSGPYLTDRKFHNVGTPGGLVQFTGVNVARDPGASASLAAVATDPLNSRGAYSDGDDGRLDELPANASSLEGAFRTPGLRCTASQPSFMHNGVYRSLVDLVDLFSRGPQPNSGYAGTPEIHPVNLTSEERRQLIAFLHALDGDGPRAELLTPLP
jgi:cytochrome c peroxidase